MNRTVAVTRMHLTDQLTLVVLPLSILASAFLINVAVWTVVDEGGRRSGGAASMWCFVGAVAIYAVVRGLPFALGMGSSRRTFTAGTTLLGVIMGASFGTLVFALQLLERATHGWGLHGRFFWYPWFGRDPWPVAWLLLMVSLVAIFLLGALVGAVWARFRMMTLIVGGPLIVIIGGAIVFLLSWRHWWHHLWHWFAVQTPASALGWSALAAVVFAAVVWVALRRYRVA